MKVHEDMDWKKLYRVHQALEQQLRKRLEIIENKRKKFDEVFIKKLYHDSYYLYEEFQRKGRQRIKKRSAKFHSGDPANDRFAALMYCEHRRKALAAVDGKEFKSYVQVRFVCDIVKDSLIIAGGSYLENLYGLAWEADLLYKYNPGTRETGYGSSRMITGPIGENRYLPDFDHQSINLCSYHHPKILTTQMENTIVYTASEGITKTYERFLQEVQRFEQNEVNKENRDVAPHYILARDE